MKLPKRLPHGDEATVVDHLGELRSRLFVAGGAILLASVAAYAVHRTILDVLISALPPNHRQLATFGIVEPFLTSLEVSLVTGFLAALPIVLWQLWGFVAPALDRGTERTVRGFTAFAAGLLVAGVVFGDRLALPAALRFLTNYDNAVYDVQIRAADYISFAVLVLAGCAVVFELPIVVLGLVRVRALSSAKLRRNRRIGYLVVMAVGVALPGVDPVTTAIETMPLLVLYEASIWLAVVFERRWRAPAVLAAPTR